MDGMEDWVSEAKLTLAAAGELLLSGSGQEAITAAFLAMVHAARAALEGRGGEVSGWEDVVRRFQAEALPDMGFSKENRRSLVIVADLYRRIAAGDVEADPITAAACLRDAGSFVEEVEARLG